MPKWLDVSRDIAHAWAAIAPRMRPLSERRALDAAFAAHQWAWLAVLRRARTKWPADADLVHAIGAAKAAIRENVADLGVLPTPRRLKQVGHDGDDHEGSDRSTEGT